MEVFGKFYKCSIFFRVSYYVIYEYKDDELNSLFCNAYINLKITHGEGTSGTGKNGLLIYGRT